MTVYDLGQDSGTFSESWPFANDITSLEISGVTLHREQLRTYDRVKEDNSGAGVMVVQWITDPDGGGGRFPLCTLDPTPDGEVITPVMIPAIGELSWDSWPVLDDIEPDWRLFPALPGRVHRYHHEIGYVKDSLAAVRLWDLWPLYDIWDIELIEDSVSHWWETNVGPYLAWADVDDIHGVCAQTGCPPEHHRHEYDSGGRLVHCQEADDWREAYRLAHTTVSHNDGGHYPLPFEPLVLAGTLGETWERLYHSSQANFQAALACYPHEQRDAVLSVERQFSSWSWL